MIGWMLWALTIVAVSGDWDPSLRGTLAVLGLLAEFLFVGYFLGVCVEIVRGALAGGDPPPGVGSFNPLRTFVSAAQGVSLAALYVLPVLTLPLLPLGIVSLAHADGLGAANLPWARRAAVRRPAQLAVLWLMLMLWAAALACVSVLLIWVGHQFVTAIPDSPTYTDVMVAGVGYAAMALVFSVAGAVLVCAMFHCIGVFGRENRDMISSAPKRATRQVMIFSAAALVISVAVFCLIILPAIRAFF